MDQSTGFVRTTWFLLVPSLALLLGACGMSGGGDQPGRVVEAYFEALVEKDGDRLVSLSCAAWEGMARQELDSFTGVPASLEGVSCQAAGSDGDFTLVSCQGAIMATYGDEDQELSLNGINYRVIREAGEWRFCGF